FQYCLFESNTAATDGGAVYLANQDRWNNMNQGFVNCLFTNNTAAATGGALFTQPNANVNAINCTFSGNSAGAGGGAVQNNGTVKLHNSIVYFNTVAGAPDAIGNTGTFHIDYSNIEGSGSSAGWTLGAAS